MLLRSSGKVAGWCGRRARRGTPSTNAVPEVNVRHTRRRGDQVGAIGGTMDFTTLVRTRRSVRGYKADPVPRDLIEEIIEVAKGAPSSMNSQPWHVHVLTGEPLEEVRRRNTEMMLAGAKPNRDIHTHGDRKSTRLNSSH